MTRHASTTCGSRQYAFKYEGILPDSIARCKESLQHFLQLTGALRVQFIAQFKNASCNNDLRDRIKNFSTSVVFVRAQLKIKDLLQTSK
jgi:hypothetical protein